jgi:predicted DNA-binding transcriptional regulator AlpA
MKWEVAMATLHFNLVQKRILDPKQAAVYVGLKTTKRFDSICPVRPISLGGGVTGYDIRDLDSWIDSLKLGAANDNVALLARLSS